METIDVNILGSQNVARIAVEMGVEHVVGISSDKACSPVRNFYGQSKAVMERLFCLQDCISDTSFSVVRYGNVVWSTGSVFNIWSDMQKEGHVITAVGPNMRRFFFTVQEAVELVNFNIQNKNKFRGQILSKKMKTAQISDVLNVWVDKFGGSWEPGPERLGERYDEYLVGPTEVDFCKIFQESATQYYLIHPNLRNGSPVDVVYTGSAEKLNKKEILQLINAEHDTI